MKHPSRALLVICGRRGSLSPLRREQRSCRGPVRLPRIAYVIDSDTVQLTDGRRVRLVQIDTPEVYNSPECYGEQASLGGLNVNVQLVRVGAAAPYFYDYRRGRYARLLVRLALRARARHLGLWGRCPGTAWDPNRGVSTGPP